MQNLTTSKKPAPQDWHKADIKAALEKRGYSLAKLSRLNGYCRGAAQMTLRIEWPRMERLIASTIGVAVQEIWPSRYHPDGSLKRKRLRREKRTGVWTKHSTANAGGNVQTKAGN